ncbi:MAG: MerR family transcriptional regulator, partial [Myxococcota bacterium]|nr:MerR family transcriptional regulator [Myxococcota bacterium]
MAEHKVLDPKKDPNLLKMSELARRCGVPAPTIKHYIREGLLPPPAVRTSRNMAYYDAGLVPRIQAIKELQRTRFLPLRVIKDMLDYGADSGDEETIANTIGRVHAQEATPLSQSRTELVNAGYLADELDMMEQLGIVKGTQIDGELVYEGMDLELIQAVHGARDAGLTPEILPFSIVHGYQAMIQRIVEMELQIFTANVVPNAGDDL